MPRATWRDVARFCEVQGYERDVGDHIRFIKTLPDGSSSGTMISHCAGGETVPARFWKRVWRDQLRLADEDEFWRGIDGAAVRYDIPPTPEESEALPSYFLRFLRDTLHYSDAQIAATDRATVQRLLNIHYARPSLADDADDG